MDRYSLQFFSHIRPLLLALCLLAAACAVPPVQQDAAAPAPAPAGPEPAAPGAALTRPHLELTGPMLYQFLAAEVAGQRGYLELAVDNYMELAYSTRDPEVVARATRIAVYARDDEAAAEAARLWLELDPDSIDAHQVLAIMEVRGGRIDSALEHFDHIINGTGEGLDQKLWVIANLLGKEQDHDLVRQVMERLIAGHENDPDALYAYAQVLHRLDDADGALEILARVLSLSPGSVNAHISYVSILQQQGKEVQARAWMEKALEGDAKDFDLRLYYARLLTEIKDYDAARRQFEILIAQAPNNPDVLYALGLLYLQSNRLDEAAGYFRRLSTLGEHLHASEADYYLGRIAEEQGDLQKAIGWYQSLTEGMNYFDAQVRLGVIYAKQDRMEDARRHLQGVPTENQQQKNILIQAEAELLTDKKLYDDAMELYNRALVQEDDASLDLLYARAMLAEKMGRLDILEQDLRTILGKDPDHSQALNALGYTLADQTTRYQEAYDLIRKALELSPNDFYVLDSMGWVLYRMGRLDEAIEYLNRALALKPDPEIAAHLGEVLWVKGDRAAARKIWEAAIKETPKDAHLLDVIQRFDP